MIVFKTVHALPTISSDTLTDLVNYLDTDMASNDNTNEESTFTRTTPKTLFKRAFGNDSASKKQNIANIDASVTHSRLKAETIGLQNGTVSPVSPEFDSITELPSPVVSEYSQNSGKKSYGSLSIRPSANHISSSNNNRITSEYGSISSMDRLSNVSGNLDARLAVLRNHAKRTVSTPFEKEPVVLEREQTLDPAAAKISPEVIYLGYDNDNILHKWKHVKALGKGTFSNVVLGQSIDSDDLALHYIAVKIVELPTQKDTRARVESSLKRELELLRFIKHPSIIKLLALLVTDTKYYLFTPYCEGGDLFELAPKHRSKLSPKIIRKMFAEIATATSYLHQNNIVHRDIKLENILVNFKLEDLLSLKNYDKPLITVTDFGLSRKIDPEDPLLTTRCGSEDYVPPELLIGLPYDGRQTDSWALGVLLYAIMEGRLPFDPPPNKSIRARSRVAHRIARIEWAWNEFSDENKGITWKEEDWSGAKYIVENLLVRREKRLTTAQVCDHPWVSECV